MTGSKWRRNELTYKISKYPRRFKKSEVDREIGRAFKMWSGVTDLKFVQKREGSVHIDIRFVVGEHGDGDPFDGPGNTLAHAYCNYLPLPLHSLPLRSIEMAEK